MRGNVLLRRQQYRLADDVGGSSAIAQAVVMAKAANCRTMLLRAAREREGGLPDVEAAAEKLGQRLEMLLRQQLTVERVRGVEGECAQHYFSVFDSLILQQKEQFVFRGRSRRPPLDAVNALLSFVYTLLVHDVTSALESVGLDPYVGFLHVDRPGRASLALDLMEELRPVLADRLVLSLINRRQVGGDGFTKAESGAVMMDEATRQEVLVAWQKRKQEEMRHPFLEEAAPLGLFRTCRRCCWRGICGATWTGIRLWCGSEEGGNAGVGGIRRADGGGEAGGGCGGWRRCARTGGSACRTRYSSAWWMRRSGRC